MTSIVQTTVFECDDVMAYVVDQKNQFIGDTPIWRGSFRMIEQEAEDTSNTNESLELTPYQSQSLSQSGLVPDIKRVPYYLMRLKMELYNETLCGKICPAGSRRDEVWAELWYNPPSEEYQCTMNGEDSVLSLGGGKFRLLVQLPGSGFHVIPRTQQQPLQQHNVHFVQVAIGLAFTRESLRIEFEDYMNQYKRRHRSYQQFYSLPLKPRTAGPNANTHHDGNSEESSPNNDNNNLTPQSPLPPKSKVPRVENKRKIYTASFCQQGDVINGNALQENLLRIAMSLGNIKGKTDNNTMTPETKILVKAIEDWNADSGADSDSATTSAGASAVTAEEEEEDEEEDYDDDGGFGDFVYPQKAT